MAYNFKNALVNLNEEIRKNNGGGDLPAVKLAVSQLQVSMAAVKSSVASVSAEVERIKADLQSLKTYSATADAVGVWSDGRTIYRKVLTFDPDISLSTTWSDVVNVTDEDFILSAISLRGAYMINTPMEGRIYEGKVGFSMLSGSSSEVNTIIYEYVEAASNNQKKKGGRK